MSQSGGAGEAEVEQSRGEVAQRRGVGDVVMYVGNGAGAAAAGATFGMWMCLAVPWMAHWNIPWVLFFIFLLN